MTTPETTPPAALPEANHAGHVAVFRSLMSFNLGLLLFAVVVGMITGVTPWSNISFRPADIWLGVLGALPMFLSIYSSGVFNEAITKRICPHLATLTVPQLLALAVTMAVSQELLFRGVITGLLQDWSPMWAIVVANVLFTLCYVIGGKPFFTMWLLGCYLSALATGAGDDNLLRSMIAFGLFLAVLLPQLAKAGRQETAAVTPGEPSTTLA